MSDFRRVYFVLSDDLMGQLESSKELSDNVIDGFGLTETMTTSMPGEDVEGLEYFALQECATQAASRGLRVVAAADVQAAAITPALNPVADAALSVSGPLPIQRIASLHVLDPAGDRDPDVELELSWYDITELAEVRELINE